MMGAITLASIILFTVGGVIGMILMIIVSLLILFCVLELGDGEIGDLMGMSRSAVQRHRTKTLNELQKKLKAHLPEGG